MGRERMAEAWFSLQIAGASEPTYISEVVDKSINPNFQFFDLNMNGPEVARSDGIQLKLWARTDRLNKFVLLIDLQICLRSLQFIGKSIDNFRQPLPLNCIVFHFEDGIYTSFTDMPVAEQSLASLSKSFAKAGMTRPDTPSTYNALMQLANVDECIRDALWMRAELERQINDHLSYSRQALEVLDRCRQAQEAVNANYRAISSEHRQIQLLRRKRDNVLASIKLRRDVVECGRTTENRNQAAIHGLHKAIREVKTQSVHTTDDSNGQIRRVCEDMALIYSLEPIKNRPLHFRIRNLYLPNSVFDDTNRDDIAAALGFTSKLTYMLSLYLSTPLPYPISPQSSHSTIQDPISVAIKERTFPLYPTNVSYKFEYGVFLLNKDIEFLMSKNGLRILDIRHTLPNLKYLLYVLTAGTGELPIRKAGGVRGLLAGQATPITSRRESEDSLNSSAGFDARQSEGQLQHDSQPPQVNGNEKAKAEAEADISGRLLPPPSGKAYAYRNSSPREAI
jgi:UV radiation resistance-associated gene protein